MVLLPCHGHHRLVNETEETLLYGKRALICVDASSLAKHGEGPAAPDGEDTSAASDLSPADRRSLLLSFYSHAAPLLPRMCRAAGEVGAMEGKGGAGPRTSEVYMCSEVCPPHPCFFPAPPQMRHEMMRESVALSSCATPPLAELPEWTACRTFRLWLWLARRPLCLR